RRCGADSRPGREPQSVYRSCRVPLRVSPMPAAREQRSRGWCRTMTLATPTVVAVSSSATHCFSKTVAPSVELIAGIGVAGDAHSGVTVRHRSRVQRDPTQPNLRQVHLMHSELFEDLRNVGFDIAPGDLGENITTRGIDLLGLGEGTS